MSKLPSIEDYITSMKTPQLIKAKELKGGECVKFNSYDIERYSGGFCVVFPYKTRRGKVAVRCWHAQLDNIQQRTKLISEELEKLNLPYFVKFHYVENGLATSEGLQPVVIMDWIKAMPFKVYIKKHLRDKAAMNKLAENFAEMVKCLHEHCLSHGDLQHGNILVKDDGSLVLVDYDSMYVPAIEGYADDIKGLEGYQHESRWTNKYVTPKADYFSELVIYLSIKALIEMPALWSKLKMEDSETMLFSGSDIKSKGQSEIFGVLKRNENLKNLTEKLIEFTKCRSIDELKPLEECINSESSKLIGVLSKSWNDHSKNTEGTGHAYSPETVTGITKDFGKNENKKKVDAENKAIIDNISKKW